MVRAEAPSEACQEPGALKGRTPRTLNAGRLSWPAGGCINQKGRSSVALLLGRGVLGAG